MKDLECIEFLQWSLPQLSLCWAGFRKVRKQVCKRLSRRMKELGLPDLNAYKNYLGRHTEEWKNLDTLSQITISRFYRDRQVFDTLRFKILPELAASVLASGEHELRCWSAGCCSGEEAYILKVIWKVSVIPSIYSDLPLRIIATDINHTLLERAKEGYYPKSILRDLPEELIRQAFQLSGEYYLIRKTFTENIDFIVQDLREQLHEGSFHLILCRNLVLTYFEKILQREIIEKISEKLVQGGILVIGIHESLPEGIAHIIPYTRISCIYQKATL